MATSPFELTLKDNENERLVFCKNRLVASRQVALLIVKPSNSILNANNNEGNITGIIKRFEEKGWELETLKLIAGKDTVIERLIAHYPQPFFDSQTDDIQVTLSAEEQATLQRTWGKAALDYPIYHPTQIVARGIGDYKTVAKVWHTGRGEDNKLLDSGSPLGINTVTHKKSLQYGKRRLLLVQNNSALPSDGPFFIVNGFTAELVTKFSRPGERIVIMLFGQKSAAYDLEYLREHVVGDTNPHHAKPGSIRHDALHSKAYRGKHPIRSLDTVGIENNMIHLSENVVEAHREIQLWLPEVVWYPPVGPFAPDISLGTWEDLRKRYIAHRLMQKPLDVSSPNPDEPQRLSALPEPAQVPAISVNMMGGGSGGRFFGYELPEHLRNKLFAPIVRIDGRAYSFLELQLARLAGENASGFVKKVTIVASENTGTTMQVRLEGLSKNTPAMNETLRLTSVLVRQGVPRIIPLADDLLAQSEFTSHCQENNLDAEKLAASLTEHAGNIVEEVGAMPGHLSVILHYIHQRLREELLQGIEIAFFHIGEDTAAIADRRFLGAARDSNAIASIEVVESSVLDKGYLIKTPSKLQLIETNENLGVHAPFYLNTSRIAINIKLLAAFLAGDVNAFTAMTESQVRAAVTEKIINKLTPRFEIKPIKDYRQWAGRFTYAIGQISEILPTRFVVCDDTFPDILSFKSKQELLDILPIIEREYRPYLPYLST